MSKKYKAKNLESLYFITLTIVDWIDLFIHPEYKHIIIDSLSFCQTYKGLQIFAYVLMTSHLHLIVKTKDGINLSDIIRDFKSHTSKKLIEVIKEQPESRKEWLLDKFNTAAAKIKRNSKYKIWQDGYHPIELSDNKIIEQKLITCTIIR
jgi:putative transposase